MRAVGRAAFVAAAAVALAALAGCGEKASAGPEGRAGPGPAAAIAAPVPHLVDLGAGRCVPCKAMAPILEQLRADYAGRLQVTFIDVWESPDQARAYRVRMIPTQIFYAADGRELARHEGFLSREDILARWQALGVRL